MKLDIIKPTVARLRSLLSVRHKAYFLLLVVLSIGFSLIETLGISAIMPFISVASNPALLESGWYKKAFDILGFASPSSFVFALGTGIVIFYIFRAACSVGLTWLMNRFSRAIYKHLATALLKTSLFLPYRLYVQKNSAELASIISGETNNASTLMLNILQFCVEFFTILLVYTLMLALNWRMTLILTVVLLVMVLGLMYVLLSKSKSLGAKRTDANIRAGRILREVFGNFKFVRLRGNENELLRDFDRHIGDAARAEIAGNTLGVMPKSILESAGFSLLILAVMAILKFYRDPARIIPLISMYALALYRILPAVHRALQNLNVIAWSQRSLEILDETARLPVEGEGSAPVSFEKSIRLENASFSYLNGGEILHNVSVEIPRGSKTAVTGESGSGKSTLIDLIIGVHRPDSGALYVDGTMIDSTNIRAWRSRIGYIPQNIYLFDGTVAENVAFGSEPDEERITGVLKMANIWDFLAAREGIHTRVGEEGIQLSGGQQQRIGIARALYDDPDLLVLDEATSALDTETEEKIMDEIYTSVSREKTLIVIAHRLSTLERCDRRIRIENDAVRQEYTAAG